MTLHRLSIALVVVLLGATSLPSRLHAQDMDAMMNWGSARSVTNQIHQWAHMPHPPRVVRALQAVGLLLGRSEHAFTMRVHTIADIASPPVGATVRSKQSSSSACSRRRSRG
jgi:hypothetical protein